MEGGFLFLNEKNKNHGGWKKKIILIGILKSPILQFHLKKKNLAKKILFFLFIFDESMGL